MKRRYYNPYTNSNNKAKILAAMQKDPTIIQHVSGKLKRDRAFIFEALQQGDLCGDVGWVVLRHVPRDAVNIRGDREIVEMAVRRSYGGMALEFAVDELRGDRELVMLAIGMGPRASGHQGFTGSVFFFASAKLQADRDVVLEAVQQFGPALAYASAALRGDREVVMAAAACPLQGDFVPGIYYALGAFNSDRDIMMAAVRTKGDALAHASMELQADREVVLAAVKHHCCALEYASRSFRSDKDVILAAVGRCGDGLKFASEELRGDRDVVLTALHDHGCGCRLSDSMFAWVSDDLKIDREVIMSAVRIDARALLMLPQKLQLDPTIVEAAPTGDYTSSHFCGNFLGSKMRLRYEMQAVFLHEELEARNADLLALAVVELCLDGPASIGALANSWLHDTREKFFLTGIIGSSGTMMGLPNEVTMGLILDFSGLREDLVVATQLKSFGTVLWHLRERSRHPTSVGDVWTSFKECVNLRLNAGADPVEEETDEEEDSEMGDGDYDDADGVGEDRSFGEDGGGGDN